MKLAASDATGLGWALLGIALSLPWLLPGHAAPWTTFYQDSAMAAVLVAPLCWTLARGPRRWPVDVFVIGFCSVALVPLLQAAAGLLLWPAEAWPVSLYLAGFALVALMAGQAERLASNRLIEALLSGLLIAALASVGLVLYQWADLSSLGVLVEPLPANGRPAANVGQANLLCTVLVWGLNALWWAQLKGRIGSRVALFAAAYLLLGIAITQSRTGWTNLALLAIVAVIFRSRLGTVQQKIAWVLLACWFVFCVVGWESLNAWLSHDTGRSMTDQASAGKRPLIWSFMLEASNAAPWLGYGWNQGMQAHLAVAGERTHGLYVIIDYAHNLVLDLIVWNGWPLGLLLAAALGAWLLHLLRRVQSADDTLLLASLAVFLIHAQLELPHAMFLFVAPVAVIAGTLAARHPLAVRWQAPRGVVAGFALTACVAFVAVVIDYREIEADLTAWRVRAARIGDLTPKPAPDVVILTALRDVLQGLRIAPTREMPPAQLATMERAVQRYPSDRGLLNLARANALNARPAEAAFALQRLCVLYPPQACAAARHNWIVLANSDEPELAKVALPSNAAPGHMPRPSSSPAAAR